MSGPDISAKTFNGKFEANAFSEGEWRCPVELVLASSQSSLVDLVRKRHAGGDRYQPTAIVFARGGRLFARLFFYGEDRPELLFALDAWLDPVHPPFGRRQLCA